MTAVAETFLSTFGKPEEETPNGLHFQNSLAKQLWEQMHQEVRSGWFLNRFLYLFGEGLEKFLPCLDAWSFLVHSGIERMIIGRNAHGALLVAEEPTVKGYMCPIFLLDPLTVRYWGDENCVFANLVGNWLAKKELPGFFDQQLYDAWVQVTGDYLDLDEVLAIKEPLSLGGKMAADNFQIENIVDYYQSTGPIYAKAFKKKG